MEAMPHEKTFAGDDAEDLRWVRKARAGSLAAFDRLVQKYQRRLYILVRKMVLNHDDANDITQEAFVKAWQGLDGFDERFAFYPWLHRIAINTTVNHMKKMSSRMEKTPVEEIAERSAGGEDPSEELTRKELGEKIGEALGELPFEQRSVFVLRTSEELSYQEIADRLGISMGTVMSRLSRAREHLKKALGPYLEEGGRDSL